MEIILSIFFIIQNCSVIIIKLALKNDTCCVWNNCLQQILNNHNKKTTIYSNFYCFKLIWIHPKISSSSAVQIAYFFVNSSNILRNLKPITQTYFLHQQPPSAFVFYMLRGSLFQSNPQGSAAVSPTCLSNMFWPLTGCPRSSRPKPMGWRKSSFAKA